jgi:ADP-ribose pyrophosphatase YjhB (NUDIX family)
MYCSNCNTCGHINKKCPKPTNSIGVIFKHKDRIVLVHRKYTHYYIKLLNFNFALHETNYIRKIIKGLTHYEYRLICSYPYEILWKSITVPFLLISNDNTLSKTNFSSKRYRYNKLLNGYNINGEYIKLSSIFQQTTHHLYPNWEIPKGKRMAHETDSETAVREFKEETGMVHNMVLNEERYKEIVFRGWDNMMYSQRFYLYNSPSLVTLFCNSLNYVQSSEINKCGWYTFDEIKKQNLFAGMCEEQLKETYAMLEELF